MNFIQYVKQVWKAGTSGGTPLSPDRLNHMEDGIKNNNSMISELNSNMTINLLKPTLQTTTQNGITCTNNGDGTYTLNGTATKSTFFRLGICSFKANKTYKILGWGNTKYEQNSTGLYIQMKDERPNVFDTNGNGGVYTPASDESLNIMIVINNGTTISNAIIKPMLTTNLNATYNDFVPYTGNTGRLNADVALLNNNISNTDNKIKTYYISTPTELTFKKGTYWVFINKTQYSQSSIWTVDSSENLPVALANPSGEKMTKVLNDDNTMTIKWNNASYAAVSLLKVVVN